MPTQIFRDMGWRVTSPYGYRYHPISGEWSFHTGIDLAKDHLHPIPPFLGGNVIFAGWGLSGTGLGGYGNVVLVEDDWGYTNMYAHLDTISCAVGQRVTESDIIGTQGATGYVTGSHLHFEIRESSYPDWGWGTHTNPGEYLELRYQEENGHIPYRPIPSPFGLLTLGLIMIGGTYGISYVARRE